MAASTDLVGYSLYLDLLGPLARGKARNDFDLGAEEVRVRHAMELAAEGRHVALVCSGDAGIYAMATLVFELMDRGGVSDAARRIEVQVSPGISALQAAAARAGDRVGLEPGAVGDVDDVHQLAGQQVGGVEQVLVDGDRADVVQVGLCHGRAVDLALHHGAQHQEPPAGPRVRGRLSISRVVPRRAATSTRASRSAAAYGSSGARSGSVIAR